MRETSNALCIDVAREPLEPAFNDEGGAFFLSCDENFAPHAAAAVASLMEHAQPAAKIDIVILNDGIAEATMTAMRSWITRYPNAVLRFITADAMMREAGRDAFHVSGHITTATYCRFFACDLFRSYDRIVYLDSDLVVLDDIVPLFRRDLAESLLAAAPDYTMIERCRGNVEFDAYVKNTLGLPGDAVYFNAGVLAMNLAAMRRQNTQKRLMETLAAIREPRYHDQDVLNAVCVGKVEILDAVWNFQEWMADPEEETVCWLEASEPTRELARQNRGAAKILHYTTGAKPWMATYYGNCGEPYWRYAALTPFHAQTREKQRAGRTKGKLRAAALDVRLQLLKYWLADKFAAPRKKQIIARKAFLRRVKLRHIRSLLQES